MPLTRYAGLAVVTAGAGMLSSLIWLVPNGFMAGTMAFCFSLGTIWLAEKERRRPGSVEIADAIAAGLVSGLLAVIPLLLLETTRPLPRHAFDFGRAPELEVWYLITAPILGGVALHSCYYLRRYLGFRRKRVIAWGCLVLVLIKTLGWTIYFQVSEPGSFPILLFSHFFSATLGSILQIVPFVGLWLYLTSRLDSSWKPEWLDPNPEYGTKVGKTVSKLHP